MPLDVNAIMDRVRQEAAKRFLAAALTLQSAHRGDLSVGNPSPHNHPAPVGDYPRLRTGGLRANIALSTTSLSEIARTGSVSVGYRPAGMHGLYLAAKGWKGILDTYQRVKGRIEAILKGS